MEYIIIAIIIIVYGCVFSNSNTNLDDSIWTYMVLLAGLCLFFERKIRLKYRCKGCKKNWALKLITKSLADKESISIIQELKNRNRNGEVIGTSEQYIPGTRYKYAHIYKCKYCGNEETRIRYVDKKNV